MSTFVLERKYALQLPNSFVDIDSDEMEYLDGGMSWQNKLLVIGACVAVGAALTVALVYGQLGLAAKIMGFTFKTLIRKLGAVGVAAVVGQSVGVSTTIVIAAFNYLK
ncbi:hypothetical protein [Clostridium sp. UBA4548]|uniref:hypothetical protein n=1 Tax=Clostridium sp. UBA4548 TaxID=1946361 RepID=UPI0025BF6C56|nr:hypothetical protein [Clostridium sp. UBA4548]